MKIHFKRIALQKSLDFRRKGRLTTLLINRLIETLSFGKEDYNEFIILHILSGNLKGVQPYIDTNAINYRDRQGRTLLHWAIKSARHTKNYEIISFLILNGASVSIEDRHGFNALDLNSQKNQYQTQKSPPTLENECIDFF